MARGAMRIRRNGEKRETRNGENREKREGREGREGETYVLTLCSTLHVFRLADNILLWDSYGMYEEDK